MTVEAGSRPEPAPVPDGPEAPPQPGPTARAHSDRGSIVLIAGNAAEELAADSSSQRAVRGGAFALTGHLIVQVLRMGGQIVLTRLVPQEAFGLMAIVHTFRAAVDLFSDIGIGPSIIQNPRGDDPRFLDTAWTLQLLRGTGPVPVCVRVRAADGEVLRAPRARRADPGGLGVRGDRGAALDQGVQRRAPPAARAG